jgi:hypothetical protein
LEKSPNDDYSKGGINNKDTLTNSLSPNAIIGIQGDMNQDIKGDSFTSESSPNNDPYKKK